MFGLLSRTAATMMLREALFEKEGHAAHVDSAHLHLEWDDEEVEAASSTDEEAQATA